MIDFLHLPKSQNGYIEYFSGFSNVAGSSWQTWNKPRGINFVRITTIGGGGGGGGGQSNATNTRTGGSGGTNSNIVNYMTPASILPDTLYISAGTGGAGGAANAAGSSGVASYVSIAPSSTAIYVLCAALAGVGGNSGNSGGTGAATPTASTIAVSLQAGNGNLLSFTPNNGTSLTSPYGGKGAPGQSIMYPVTTIHNGASGAGGFASSGGSILTQNSATFTLTSISNSLIGAASLTSSTTPTNGTNDDGNWALTLPWNISYNGNTYSNVYVGTNSYITFDQGGIAYSGIIPTLIPVDKIMIRTSDNSCQRIYYGTEGVAPDRTYRIRYEGTNATSGTLGSPNMVWEAVFYENAPAKIDIQVGTMAQTSTTNNGLYSSNQQLTSGSSVSFGAANTGVQIVATNPIQNSLFSPFPGGVGGTVGSVVGGNGSMGFEDVKLLLSTGGAGGGSGYDGNTGSNGGRGGNGGFGSGGGGGGAGVVGGTGGNGGPGLIVISCW